MKKKKAKSKKEIWAARKAKAARWVRRLDRLMDRSMANAMAADDPPGGQKRAEP